MTDYWDWNSQEQLLESDDELPCSYDESPSVPAYQNDNRFDIIDFPWLNIKTKEQGDAYPDEQFTPRQDISSSSAGIGSTGLRSTEKSTKPIRKKLLTKGVLTKQDLFCLKCMATESTHKLLVWFINFLIQEDMQSDYNFLHSCLVGDWHVWDDFSSNFSETTEESKYVYDVIVL